MSKIETLTGQLFAPSDLGRVLLTGEIAIRDPVDPYQANLPTATTDRIFGAYDEAAGFDPGQPMPGRFVRRGERRLRIEDSAVVAVHAELMPSATDPGSAVTATGSGVPFARALTAAAGTVGQYIHAEIYADGLSDFSAPRYTLNASFPDYSAASTEYLPIGIAGIVARVDGAITESVFGNTSFSLAVNGTPAIGVVAFVGPSIGDTASAVTSAVVAPGDTFEIIGDGGGSVAGRVNFTVTIEA